MSFSARCSSSSGLASLAGAALRSCGAALLLALAVRPAAAELRVRVSKTVTGKWQSVGITVTDPRQGLDTRPEPLAVTMADGRDRRQTIYLHPTGQPGVWTGRYTPTSTGRFTGTAVLEREHDKDIGLVPLIRVRASNARGFVRRHPRSRRALQYSNGGTLFPIPLRISAADLTRVPDWHAEVARMRAHDVNLLEVPVAWPESLPGTEREEAAAAVDRLLVEAERSGRLAVLLRLEAPDDVSGTGAEAYRAQLGQWARRWAYSPAVAAWYLAGATEAVSAEQRAAFVRAVREVDPHDHLVAVPDGPGGPAPADLTVAPLRWQRPANQYSLLEAQEESGEPVPLPGEATWQSLVLGGIGLPIQEYRPGTPEGETALRRIGQLARAAGKVPYQVTGVPVTGLVPADTPGSFSRYGRAVVGWVAPDADHTFALPKLSAGRYELLLWDPERDRFLDDSVLRFDGSPRRLKLPDSLTAVYFMLRPAAGGAAVPSQPRAAARPRPAMPVPTPAQRLAATSATPRPVAKKVAVRRPAAPPRKTKASATSRRNSLVKAAAKPGARRKPAGTKAQAAKTSRRVVKAQPKRKPSVTKKTVAKSAKASKRPAPKKPAKAGKATKKKTAPKKKIPAPKKPVRRRR